MVFSSLFFVFFFLVLCYSLYALMPGIRSRNWLLLLSSLVFYAWGGPPLLLLLAGMTLVCYLGGRLMEWAPRRRRLWMVLTAVLCLGLLGGFKYTGFFLSTLQSILGISFPIPTVALPIGISFYTFQLLSYVADVYRGEAEPQRRYDLLLLYASLFHQCVAGPIVRYSDVCGELNCRRVTREDMAAGVTRFSCGLAKKAVLANGCAAVVGKLLERPDSLTEVSALGILTAAVCYMLQIYLDFSAYSDMAIGMGLAVGFHYRENFRYPYAAHSVTDFWRRWHISLSGFFRDYVYVPLGGNRVGPLRHILNLLTVWLLTGLWHGASWNFVLWGLYHFLLLFAEKFIFKVSDKPSCGLVRGMRTAYTLVAVLFGWMLFYYTDLGELATALKGLLTLNGNPWADAAALNQLTRNILLILVSAVACTPVLPWLSERVEALRGRRGEHVGRSTAERLSRNAVTVWDLAAAILPVGLVLLSLLCLVGDSYNPFLYYRF